MYCITLNILTVLVFTIFVLKFEQLHLTLVLLNPGFANSVDPDQLASGEANWSGSTLFVIKYMNLY